MTGKNYKSREKPAKLAESFGRKDEEESVTPNRRAMPKDAAKVKAGARKSQRTKPQLSEIQKELDAITAVRKTVNRSFSITEDQNAALKLASLKLEKSVNSVLRQLLDEWMESEEFHSMLK